MTVQCSDSSLFAIHDGAPGISPVTFYSGVKERQLTGEVKRVHWAVPMIASKESSQARKAGHTPNVSVPKGKDQYVSSSCTGRLLHA